MYKFICEIKFIITDEAIRACANTIPLLPKIMLLLIAEKYCKIDVRAYLE